ncbi:unnamed protein product [Rhodiola kirilowii]
MTTMKDFLSMTRKKLQALCKKHGVPANLKNAEMAERLFLLHKDDKSGEKEQSDSGEIRAMEVKVKKKVRFHPENEVYDADIYSEMVEQEQAEGRRERAARRSLRKHGLTKAGNLNAVENGSSDSKDLVSNQVRLTRSRKSIVIRSPPLRKRAKTGGKAGSETGEVSSSHSDVADSVQSNADKEKESEMQFIGGKGARLTKANTSTSLDSEFMVEKQNANEIPKRRTRSQIKFKGDDASVTGSGDAMRPVIDHDLLNGHSESVQHEVPLRKSSRVAVKIKSTMPEIQKRGSSRLHEKQDNKRARNEVTITIPDRAESIILSREKDDNDNLIKEDHILGKPLRRSRSSTSTSKTGTGFEHDSGKEKQWTPGSLEGDSPMVEPLRRSRRKSSGYDASGLFNADSLPGYSNQINQPMKGKRSRGLKGTSNSETKHCNEVITRHDTHNSLKHDLLVEPDRLSKLDCEQKNYKKAKRSARLRKGNRCIESCPVENDLLNKTHLLESKDVSSSGLLSSINVVKDGISSIQSMTPSGSDTHDKFVEACVSISTAPVVEESTMSTAQKASVLDMKESSCAPAVGEIQISACDTDVAQRGIDDAFQRDLESELRGDCSELSDSFSDDVPLGCTRDGIPKISTSNLLMEVEEKHLLYDEKADYDTLLSAETKRGKGIRVSKVEEVSVSDVNKSSSVPLVGEIQITACDTDVDQRETLRGDACQRDLEFEVPEIFSEISVSVSHDVPRARCTRDRIQIISNSNLSMEVEEKHVLSDEKANYDTLLSTETERSKCMEISKAKEASVSDWKHSSSSLAVGEIYITACDIDVVQRETHRRDAVQRDVEFESPENRSEFSNSLSYDVPHVGSTDNGIPKISTSNLSTEVRQKHVLSDDKAHCDALLSSVTEISESMEVSKVEEAMKVFYKSAAEGEDATETSNNWPITREVKVDTCGQIWRNIHMKQNAVDGESKETLSGDAEQSVEFCNEESSFVCRVYEDNTIKERGRVATSEWQLSLNLLESEGAESLYGDINKDEMASDDHALANEQGQCSFICNLHDAEGKSDGHWKQNSESVRSTSVHGLTCDELYYDKSNSEMMSHDQADAHTPGGRPNILAHLDAEEDIRVVQFSEPLEARHPIVSLEDSTSEEEVISIEAGSIGLWNFVPTTSEYKEVGVEMCSQKDSSSLVGTNIDEKTTNCLAVQPSRELDNDTNVACGGPYSGRGNEPPAADNEFAQDEHADCTHEVGTTLHVTNGAVDNIRNAASNDVSLVNTASSFSFHETLAEKYAETTDPVDYSTEAYTPHSVGGSIVNKTAQDINTLCSINDSFSTLKELKSHDDKKVENFDAYNQSNEVSQDFHKEFKSEGKRFSTDYLDTRGSEEMVESSIGLEKVFGTDIFNEPSCHKNTLVDQATVSSEEAIAECITDDYFIGERGVHQNSTLDSRVKQSITEVMNGDEDDNTYPDLSDMQICYHPDDLHIAEEATGELLKCGDTELILTWKDAEVVNTLKYKASTEIGDLMSADLDDREECNVKKFSISKERESTSSGEIPSFDKLDGLLREIDEYFEWTNSSDKVLEGCEMSDDSKETELKYNVETTSEAMGNKTENSYGKNVVFHESKCNVGMDEEVYAATLEGHGEQMNEEIAAYDEVGGDLMIEDGQFDHHGDTLEERCSEELGLAGCQSGETSVNHAQVVQTTNQSVISSDLDVICSARMSHETDSQYQYSMTGNDVDPELPTEGNRRILESGMVNAENYSIHLIMLDGTEDIKSEHFADDKVENGLTTEENAELTQTQVLLEHDGVVDASASVIDDDSLVFNNSTCHSDSKEANDGNLHMLETDTTSSPGQAARDRDVLMPPSSCDSAKGLPSSNENLPAVCHSGEGKASEVHLQPMVEATLAKLDTVSESDDLQSSLDGYVEVAFNVLHNENLTEIPLNHIAGLNVRALEKDDHNSDDQSATVDAIENENKCEGTMVKLNLRVLSSLSTEPEMFEPSQGLVANGTMPTPHGKKNNQESISEETNNAKESRQPSSPIKVGDSTAIKQQVANAMKENITPFSKTDPQKCTKTVCKRRVLGNIRNN